MEAALDWQARASDRRRYRAWLERLYGFHRIWDPAVACAVADPALVEPRRKLTLLVADLGRLDVAVSALDALPSPPPLRFVDAAEALGSMYVLEGSALGGKLIARHVRASLGFAPAYHDPYGDRAGAMWREFQSRLESIVTLSRADGAVASAKSTFEHLRAWLTSACPR